MALRRLVSLGSVTALLVGCGSAALAAEGGHDHSSSASSLVATPPNVRLAMPTAAPAIPTSPGASATATGATSSIARSTLAARGVTADASGGWATKPVGTVISSEPLAASLWIPNTTAQAYRLQYVSTDADGNKALTSGEVFIPKAASPAGGWPVISWAHGTSGLGDSCAPSVMGPAEPSRDFPVLSKWMAQGYAIVATDYAGLGTPGLPAYLNGVSEAHNVVDMVKAGRAFVASSVAGQRFSNRWAVVGQSQGGGASIYTARYATAFGGPTLNYVGAVGTGVPAYIENYVDLLGPEVAVPLPGSLTAYMTMVIASLRTWRPDLGIDRILTPTGQHWVQQAENVCIDPLTTDMANVTLGSLFAQPLVTLPHLVQTVDAYMKMPESGFDRPFFMAHGLLDTDVPFAQTARYVAILKLNGLFGR